MAEETLFEAALALSKTERGVFLERECGADSGLRARVQTLLSAHEAPELNLDRPRIEEVPPAPSDITALMQPTMKPDVVIGGRYALLEKIGEGGMGEVWVAKQSEPVKRRVALKLIKTGMDSKAVLSRFEQERQALGMMDHPNIAKVLDGGMTPTGRPFFVMELVNGLPLLKYCDETKLNPGERLELFVHVCQAVQHAHQKGIVHRDLKPANILVTTIDGVGVPKVIDFGVAKATAGKLTDESMFTQFGAVVGTLEYMAPEQAGFAGEDIDTRADIYSLGVILYELLTGLKPIDAKRLKSTALLEMIRVIKEEDPPRPSTRLSKDNALASLAAARQIDPRRLMALLRGELDWVVMKCLEKKRDRRYETANGLATDIRRYLANEPVAARPPSLAYRAQKAWQRNRLAYSAAGAVALALLVGIAASLWQATRANQALDELRASAPAFAEQARTLAAKERFDDAIDKLNYAIKLRPDVAEYLVAKGDLLQCQFKLAEAAKIYRLALRVKPGMTRATESAQLCDDLLAAPLSEKKKLSRESLATLHVAMQTQQRPAAELLPVARLLGEEKALLVDYWAARLMDLPVSAERPLKDRLTVRDDGKLALDLSDTKVVDLSPLAGAPLAALNVSSTKAPSALTDLAPLQGLELIALNIANTNVADLGPLREMRTLEKLDISNSKVRVLAALSELRLKTLFLTGCPISDLNPIRKMPLEELNLRETRVTDLSPLIGMPIKLIDLTRLPVLDFSPLAKLPLEKCYLQYNRITDLAVLRGAPLKKLALWGCIEARNFVVLSEIKTLELLLLPSEYRSLPNAEYESIGALRTHPKLRQIGSEIMNKMGYSATGSKEIFWRDWDTEQSFIPALRKSGFNFALNKLPTGSYFLDIEYQPLGNISFLKGAPISELTLVGCKVTDLSPLRDLPLELLNIPYNPITDLSALRGKQIKTLYLTSTKVSDLSPLTEVPLKALYLSNCENVTDVASLAKIPSLEMLTVPMQAANIGLLRKLPKLARLAYELTDAAPYIPDQTAEEFWRENGPDTWIGRLRDSAVKVKRLKRLADGTWEVNLDSAPITDLSILHGAPISSLSLSGTAVSDLSPLRGMPLRWLHLFATNVTDLSPLQGMALTYLNLVSTKVSDISALRGMPLTSVRLNSCTESIDLSPLADCKALTSLTIPMTARNIELLRTFPKLERIGFHEDESNGWRAEKTAAEFWKEYDAKKKLGNERN